MRFLLTMLALGCLLRVALAQPPLPILPLLVLTNKTRIPTNYVKRVPPAIPDTTGKSYTNVISSLPAYWRKTNGGDGGTNFIPHNARHDTNTWAVTLDWASTPGQTFLVWWTGDGSPFYPFAYYHEIRQVGTNLETWPVYPQTGAWFGTNRTRWEYTFDRSIKPGHWLIERKT